jgi:hypothetical protein
VTVHISRADELDYIFSCVTDAECCAIVGLSNMGKSVLLRSVKPAARSGFGGVQEHEYAFIYIDFNLMVEMTEQAFYELILRSASTMLSIGDDQRVRERVESAYRKVVDSSNPFLIPLGFNEGIMALCEELGKQIVLLFDEFDEPFGQIDQRVFLNLRALKDRYDRQLCYVVATGKRLEDMRHGSEIGEFCEMFAHQTLHLSPLHQRDMQHAVTTFLIREGLTPTEHDLNFVWMETGGHPGLVDAVCHVLAATGGVESESDYSIVREKLDSDPNVRNECIKLWNGLDGQQQETLIDLVGGEKIGREKRGTLFQNGILREVDQVFGALFSGFVRRQRLVKSPYLPGVRVDVDAGAVWVDGKRTVTLTELEYRLLLLLYGRIGKICDKYQIVEAVWGEEYLDQVDDARIEKLVSRLRKKIEPNPNEPRYLKTVRGRGYRLVEV